MATALAASSVLGALGALLAAPASFGASSGALAWGSDTVGQLGVDDTLPFSFSNHGEVWGPAPLGTLSSVSAIAAGDEHALGLLDGSTVVAWGRNSRGQLGVGSMSGPEACEGIPCSKLPVTVGGLSGVKAVAAGLSHSLALLSNGTVMAWGDNGHGQLGTGSVGGAVTSPTLVPGLSGVKAIAAGEWESFALLENGTVKAWGSNEFGALGIGALEGLKCEGGGSNCFPTPRTLPGLSEVKAIAAAALHALALREDGTVMSWGSNAAGEVADGSQTDRYEPVAISGLSEVVSVAAGDTNGAALIAAGSVRDWGSNRLGELGIGNNTGPEECLMHSVAPAPCSTAPVAVTGLSGVSEISSGRSHTLALLGDGVVMAWGLGEYGDLGQGESGSERCGENGALPRCNKTPAPVNGLDDALGIAAGGYESFATVNLGPARPVVTKIEPESGPREQAATVTITGTDLAGATAVTFGSVKAARFTVNSETSITATSPSLPTQTLDISVRTPEGYSAFTPVDRFAFTGPPILTSVLPKSGPTVGGTHVVISGREFSGVTAVRFGAANASSFTVTSPTSISAVTPPGANGVVPITVVNAYGSTTGLKFSYAPVVESVAPNSGPAAGHTTVTVTGTGFRPGENLTVFKFAAATALNASCASTTTCTVITPPHAAGKVDAKATVNKVTSARNRPGDLFTYK